MKVLYVASNPQDAQSLNLEREITELQMRAAEAVGEEVSFVFLPKLAVEDLHSALAKHRPDVLHVAAHADPNFLSLANEADRPVALTAKALRAFLPRDYPPRLIYLNACNSKEIAEQLIGIVPMAIGTTAPISNRAARAGAVIFYEKILAGENVMAAFEAGREMIAAIDSQTVESALAVQPGCDPSKEVLQRVPRLIASMTSVQPKRKSCSVRFGLVGCPADTIQVVFFTDDLSFYEAEGDEEEDLAAQMCVVARNIPIRGVIWVDEDDEWQIYGDFRLFAVGVTGDGRTFSVGSTLCDAIETKLRLTEATPDEALSDALAWLRGNDGGNLHEVIESPPLKQEGKLPARSTDAASPAKRVRVKKVK